MNNDLQSLSDQATVDRCYQETQHYLKEKSCNEQFCFEVLRRYCIDHADLRPHIRRIYTPIVIEMIEKHWGYNLFTDDRIDALNQKILTEWMDNLELASFELRSLRAALKYLKRIVTWRVTDELRRIHRSTISEITLSQLDYELADFSDGPELQVERKHRQFAITQRLVTIIPDPTDRLLCYLRFGEGLSPKQIVLAYPDCWPVVDLIYQRLPKLKQLLFNDPILRQLGNMGEK